jgi:flavin-dependent dehydrogenase
LADAGHPQPDATQSDCGLLYYSRHYRLRDDAEDPPYASVLAGPRGDLGYLAFAVFAGDNRTFCLCVMVPPSDKPFRGLRDPEAFERVAALLPAMRSWRELAEPITGVLPMGHLHNVLHAPTTLPGLVAVGDARCHTNPTFAFGASLSLQQGALLADLAGKAADLDDLAGSFAAEVDPDLRSRFDAVTAEDAERARVWGGEPLDVTDPAAAPQLHQRSVVYRVALQDPEVLRAVTRRVNALDPVEALGRRSDLLERAQVLYEGVRDTIPAPPPREQLLSAVVGG